MGATATIASPVAFERVADRPRDASDDALVGLAAGGDPAAFGELVRRHQGRVRGLLVRLTGDTALADDLAQETFMRAHRGLAGFESRARFTTWLHRIAYNLFLNHRTRSKFHVSLPDTFDSEAVARDYRCNPARVEAHRDVTAAMAQLPVSYRAALSLYYLEEFSYPEAAGVLEIPLGTLKTHIHRGKRMLREILAA
jgi:RNA polymerase sigma-70 factor (ECF subfamily)